MKSKLIDQVREDYRLIKAFTNYELIEIEQTRPPSGRVVSKLQGFQVYKYKARMDDTTDPENPTVSDINGRIDGDTIQFVENPFPGSRKPFGTGKVAYILDDNLPADPKEFPDGYLSGAEKGYNLEVLATHYNEQLWKIVDPKIEEDVKKRSEAIQQKVSNQTNKHIFGNRYDLTKSGNQEKEIKISLDQPNNELREMMTKMQRTIDAQAEKIEAMGNPEKKAKNPGKPTAKTPKEVKSEPQVLKESPNNVSSFAK